MKLDRGKSLSGHKDLDVWKKAVDLVEAVYKITSCFPNVEMYGLTSQMRRAAVSVPSNIAEGAARNGKKEFAQFLYISLGSLAELETQLIVANRLKYVAEMEPLSSEILFIKRMLNGLIVSLGKSSNK